MFASVRRDKIIQWLQRHEQLIVKELAKEFNVSEGTLRTDLRMLEEEGVIERTHGGAVLAKRKSVYRESATPSRSEVNYAEKQAIGLQAANLVSKGQCILLDASSTVLEVAKALADYDYITVVTNGLDAAMVLNQNPRINVILIGGVLRSGSRTVEGVLGKGILDGIHGDLFFTSAEGVSMEEGMTDFSLYEAELKKQMAANARMTIALADHTKLGRRSIATSVSFDRIDTLITDDKADSDYLRRIKGIRVVIASTNVNK
ncbi:DeoR/GlpR family DNA-binding transcription regulator [Paenibacillus harenae]|uniref:DeoR/GlpR family transcriptional regulator of sugar metabolism n=1 Tax=Paenibacillus harenae TaxID=306543 RepID=A0ABT9TZ42_PAEHA|nr:DeoR/GlpR family DNA-binding transcription regulator [Paenibacillus harenae]MDQ0060330.1 DeoR/GlpR family transcriptional regulator of sugar metabolism [Paenibacillus harenae]MDQ0112136.1 DeoR/GlpR family transcriptional regulator of sugar metabolism [Paenibacillus harenae]